MTEARIGRIVVAAVHQALADIVPSRLEFYENYLKPMRLRHGTIGRASFQATLSFLRREDAAYASVVENAGRYAADWSFASESFVARAYWRHVPQRFRARQAVRLARRLVHETAPDSRARGVVEPGSASLEIRGSVFCGVRHRATEPLCGFYAAAFEKYFELLRLDAAVHIAECRAVNGGDTCRLVVSRPAPAGL